MKMNLFIFASKRKHLTNLILSIGLFYLFLLVSFLCFKLNPMVFYWRSWEYFDEVVYNDLTAAPWKGLEKGNMSRDYLFSNQVAWETEVSCDEQGFRSVPFSSNCYPILMVGDSNTWGSGLSDQETIPWILAQRLNLPVFNGGRSPERLAYLLNNPRLKNSKIIVEISSGIFENLTTAFNEEFSIKEEYSTYASNYGFDIFSVHPKRYFLPLKFLRSVNILSIYNELKKQSDRRLTHLSTTEREFNAVFSANKIIRRATVLNRLGYRYVFAHIPESSIDSEEIRIQTIFYKHLCDHNVNCVNLAEIFTNTDNILSLFFATDSHLNSKGALLVAESLENYINLNFASVHSNFKH